MKKTVLILFFIFLIKPIYANSIGLSYGSSFINQPSTYHSNMNLVPKQLALFAEYSMTDKNSLFTKMGFARKKLLSETNTGHELLNGTEELSGMSFELEYQTIASLDRDKTINLFWGLGAGYYNYSYTNNYQKTWEKDYNGLAQFFSFGFSTLIHTKAKMFIHFKKMGFSNIKEKQAPSGSSGKTIDYVSKSGLKNLELSVGLCYIIN